MADQSQLSPAYRPTINDDCLRKIVSYLPSSMNICLVNRLFRRSPKNGPHSTVEVQTHHLPCRTNAKTDGPIPWLFEEASRIQCPQLRNQAMCHVVAAAASRGCVEFFQYLSAFFPHDAWRVFPWFDLDRVAADAASAGQVRDEIIGIDTKLPATCLAAMPLGL